MGLVRQVVETLKIPLLEVPRFEADDILATLATQARDRGDDVIVVTGDRAAYQLVEDPHVKVLYNRRGVSDHVLYDEAGIKDRTGVTPELYPQYAALRGDPSDNLPGVPGVGEKTAAKLINTYGDLDGVFANVELNTPKLRENLQAHEAQVRQNAQATPLVRDVPLDTRLDDLRMGQWDADEVRNLFTFLEFRTLWDRLIEAVGGVPTAEASPTRTLDVDLQRLATVEEAVAGLQRLAGSKEPGAAAPAGQLDLDGGEDRPAEDAGRRAVAVARLAPALRDAMAARNLFALYDDIERPLIRVLARMEKIGVRVDVEYLRELIVGLETEVRRLEKEIQDDAGETFVVNSTQQLRRILFEKLGLQPQKRTKTGFSTDAASLEKLRGQHPIIEKLLRYREVEKLRSTYGESLLAFVSDDARIRASFNQTVARTGRLSSENPNLHNIPIRREEGRRFRRAFIPADGWQFLVADYNQIELRVIAHLAEDPGLIEAFTTRQDIHATTAARIFGVDPDAVDVSQRSTAKMVSYGLAYGMEAYGLGQRLGIPTEDAALILSAYFQAFPKVKEYMERVVAEARDRGYTETMFGRRRQIPELSSTNYRIRQAGERQAMNAGIQGLAADIFKIALVRLDKSLEEEGRETRLALQVHDEVILEVPPDEHDRAAELTLAVMSGACELCVDLAVNVSWGDSWADAKG